MIPPNCAIEIENIDPDEIIIESFFLSIFQVCQRKLHSFESIGMLYLQEMTKIRREKPFLTFPACF